MSLRISACEWSVCCTTPAVWNWALFSVALPQLVLRHGAPTMAKASKNFFDVRFPRWGWCPWVIGCYQNMVSKHGFLKTWFSIQFTQKVNLNTLLYHLHRSNKLKLLSKQVNKTWWLKTAGGGDSRSGCHGGHIQSSRAQGAEFFGFQPEMAGERNGPKRGWST